MVPKKTTWLWCSSNMYSCQNWTYGSLSLSKCINCMHFNLFYWLHSLRISDIAANVDASANENFNPIKMWVSVCVSFYAHICLTCTTYPRLFIYHIYICMKKSWTSLHTEVHTTEIARSFSMKQKLSFSYNNLFLWYEINWRKYLRVS